MLNNKKEIFYKNNIVLLNVRHRSLLFHKYLLLSNLNCCIKVNAYSFIYYNNVKNKTPLCLLTNRGGSINKTFNLSRIMLKKLICEGIILGFKKSSW